MLVVSRIFAASVLVALAGTLVLMIVAIPDVPTTVGTGCPRIDGVCNPSMLR
jgi:hypothetical protein